MKKIILFFCFCFLYLGTNAQEAKPGIAVLIDWENFSNPYNKVMLDEIVKRLNTSKRSSFQFYNWKEKEELLEFRYTESNEDPRPCEKLVFLNPYLSANEKPELIYKKDKEGTITEAYFDARFYYSYQYKIIDLATSVVEDINKITPSGNKQITKKFPVENLKAVLRADPDKLKKSKPAEYRKKVNELRKKYNKEILKFLNESTKDAKRSVAGIAGILKSSKDDRLYKVVDLDPAVLEEKGKIKEFKIDAGTANDVKKGSFFDMVKKSKYGDKTVIEDLAYVIVKEELTENTSLCKPFIFSGKKVSNALREGAEVYITRNKTLLKSINRTGEKTSTAVLDKKCTFCGFELERQIGNLSNIELIEKDYDKILEHFITLSKKDQFLDFDLATIQGKQKGARYIIGTGEKKIIGTDVETGRRFEETPETSNDGFLKKFYKENSGISKAMISRLFMELFEVNTELIEVSEQKKDKVKKVIVYNPVGFNTGEKYKVYKLSEEKVKDKVISRKLEIGVAWVHDLKSNQVAELAINKGKEEIFTSIKNKEKIIFINE